MFLHHSDLYKRSDFLYHLKSLTSNEICDGAIFRFAGYNFAFMWNKRSVFIFNVYGCIKDGQHVSNKRALMLEFCAIAAVNEIFVKFFKDKSKSTSQYDIWYINTERAEVDIQVESVSVNPKKSSISGKSIKVCS